MFSVATGQALGTQFRFPTGVVGLQVCWPLLLPPRVCIAETWCQMPEPVTTALRGAHIPGRAVEECETHLISLWSSFTPHLAKGHSFPRESLHCEIWECLKLVLSYSLYCCHLSHPFGYLLHYSDVINHLSIPDSSTARQESCPFTERGKALDYCSRYWETFSFFTFVTKKKKGEKRLI